MTKKKVLSAEEALENLEEKSEETAPAGLGTPTAHQHPVRLSPVTVVGSGIHVPGQQHVTSPLSTPGGMRTNETVVHGPAKTIHYASGQPIKGIEAPKPPAPAPEQASDEDEEEDEPS